MQIVIVRDNIVENIGTPPMGTPPEGTTAHEFAGFVSIGWEWNNGAPADPSPPPPAPPTNMPLETTKLRFALELKARGMWPAVKAAIEANEDASMYWDFTDIVRSDNQMLLAMASQLNISTAQVREIITAAIARQV